MSNRDRVLTLAVFVLRTISLLSLIGFISGVLFLVFVIVANADQQRLFNAVGFPLANVSNVIIDADDRVIVNNVGFGRVQIYDENGQFLCGFFSAVPHTPSQIGFDANGNVAVAAHRSDRIRIFTNDGALLKETQGGKEQSIKWEKNPQWTKDSSGREYVVRNRAFSPQVVKRLASGDEIFLSTPFYLWPFVAPVPCLVSIVLTQFVSNRLKRKIRGDETENLVNQSA